MSATLTFRKANSEDVPALLPLIRSAYRGEASREGWTHEADLVADERIDEEGLLVKIHEPYGAVLLAFDEAGTLVSCCEILKRDDILGYFGLFAVNPKLQGGGIGKKVLAAAEAYAKDTLGLAKLEMSVIWTRDELISWYIRRGYVKTDEKKPFPYEHLVNGQALRDDLYFSVLLKTL
jgi:GNAT superfamily N-acetyltransferase